MPQVFRIGSYCFFPTATLNNIIRIIEMRIPEIETKWKETFGQISYYC